MKIFAACVTSASSCSVQFGRAVGEGGQGLDQQITAEIRELRGELVGGLSGDSARRLGAIGARVDAVADAHDGYTGLGIAFKNGALDRRRTAPAGEQRSVDVHAAQRSHGENLVRKDAAVCGDAEDVGLHGAEWVVHLGRHAISLEHGKPEFEGGRP